MALSAPMWNPARTVRRVALAGIVLGLAIHQARGFGSRPSLQLQPKPLVTLRLQGSSPSVAWSPDGLRLAVNAGFCVHHPDYNAARKHKGELGVYLVDAQSGQVRRVARDQGFHPFWLNDETLGFVNSYYEEGPDGLFLTGIHAHARLRKLGDHQGVFQAHLGRSGRILIWGHLNEYGWHLVDPATGKAIPVAKPEPAPDAWEDPWQTPDGLVVSQCLQRAGGVETGADGDGIWLRVGGQKFVLSGERPFRYDFEHVPESGKGPVQPCLSPGGHRLAFVTGHKAGGYQLKVMAVPAYAEALASAREAPAPSAAEKTIASGTSGRLQAACRLRLHGSTPSMAWSPDSSRVVVNSAFEYYGYDRQIAKLAGRLGVYVLDARTGQSLQVTSRQGYHPFWLNRGTVGWGHSKYEEGKPGVFMAKASRQARVRRIGKLEGIHRTLPGSDGRILAYVGFPEYKKWTWIDPDGGRGIPAAAFEGLSSWEMPRKGVRDQCLQQVGSARIEEHAEHGYVVVTGTGSWAPGDMPLFTFREGYGQAEGGKAVRPCLSPDGKWIAYLGNPGGSTSYELQIAALPQ